MILISYSVLTKFFKTFVFVRSLCKIFNFTFVGLKADSIARDKISIQIDSITAWIPSLSRFENFPLMQ